MNVYGEIHGAAFYVLPSIVVSEGFCECCKKASGWAVSLSWIVFSIHLEFIREEGHGER